MSTGQDGIEVALAAAPAATHVAVLTNASKALLQATPAQLTAALHATLAGATDKTAVVLGKQPRCYGDGCARASSHSFSSAAAARSAETHGTAPPMLHWPDLQFVAGSRETFLALTRAARTRQPRVSFASALLAAAKKHSLPLHLAPRTLYLNLHDQGAYAPGLLRVALDPPPGNCSAHRRASHVPPPPTRIVARDVSGAAPLIVHAGDNTQLLDQLASALPHLSGSEYRRTQEALSSGPFRVAVGVALDTASVFVPETLAALAGVALPRDGTCTALVLAVERGVRLVHMLVAITQQWPGAELTPEATLALAAAKDTVDNEQVLAEEEEQAAPLPHASAATETDTAAERQKTETPAEVAAETETTTKREEPATGTLGSACKHPRVVLCKGSSACTLAALRYSQRGSGATHVWLTSSRALWAPDALQRLIQPRHSVVAAALHEGWATGRPGGNIWPVVMGGSDDGCFDRWSECQAWVAAAERSQGGVRSRSAGSAKPRACDNGTAEAAWLKQACPVACELCPPTVASRYGKRASAERDGAADPRAGTADRRESTADRREGHAPLGLQRHVVFGVEEAMGTVQTPQPRVRVAAAAHGVLLHHRAAQDALRGVLADLVGTSAAARWLHADATAAAHSQPALPLPPAATPAAEARYGRWLATPLYADLILSKALRRAGYVLWACGVPGLGSLVSPLLSPRWPTKQPRAVAESRWAAEADAMTLRALTRRRHPELYLLEANPALWHARYLHPKYNATRSLAPVRPGCWDIFEFPLLSQRACTALIEEAEAYGRWSGSGNADDRLAGGYENVPTQDIHLWQLGLRTAWLVVLRQLVAPIVSAEWAGYHVRAEPTLDFIVRYRPDTQASLRPHHDSSLLSLNVALNGGDAFEGGGTHFLRQNCTLVNRSVGYALFHPGRMTHKHEGLLVTRGTRYILVSFVD